MTDQEINIAIAEACGWTHYTDAEGDLDEAHLTRLFEVWTSPNGNMRMAPPDYCDDLNAIRSAVLSQSEQFQEQFDTALKNSGKRIAEMGPKEWATIFLQCE